MQLPKFPFRTHKSGIVVPSHADSPSGFWPLGESRRAAIVNHSIDQRDDQHRNEFGALHSDCEDGVDNRVGRFASVSQRAFRPDLRPASSLRKARNAMNAGMQTEPASIACNVEDVCAFARSLADPVAFFAQMFAHSPVGLAVFHANGRIAVSNPAAQALFGSQPPPEYNLFTDHMAIEQGIAAAMQRAFAGATVSLPMVWYDPRDLRNVTVTEGKRVAISISIFPIPNATGQIDHAAIVYRDDTTFAMAQEQLESQSQQLEHHIASRTAELEAANEELEAFSYSVSHDLRAPLRAIDGFAALLANDEQTKLSNPAKEWLHRIRNATGRMSDLINDLLAFSRLGKQALTVSSVAPIQLVNQVLQELEPKLCDRAINIRVGKLPICQADPALLREVFLNLLDNAIKFTGKRDHAQIEIGTRVQDKQLVWYVSDNGVGFDMAQYQRLFGVFSRLHSSEEFEGTGVGLALVHRIVKRHGGDVWAYSEPNKGTTFYFTLKG